MIRRIDSRAYDCTTNAIEHHRAQFRFAGILVVAAALFLLWQPPARATPHPGDAAIHKTVQRYLATETSVVPGAIDIDVKEGIVMLSGLVDTLYAKQAAEADALNTTGVWKVDNQLQLRYRAFPPDDDVERMIGDIFRCDAELTALDFEAAVSDNHLKLSGTVATKVPPQA